MKTISEMRRAN